MSGPREAAAFLASCAKEYNAGAFATPTAKDLASGRYEVVEWPSGLESRTMATVRTVSQPSHRSDFTGERYVLPVGARVIDHLGRTRGAPVPDLSAYDFIHVHTEDADLTSILVGQGREPVATRITAASEMITCWGRRGTGHCYASHDVTTLLPVQAGIPLRQRDAALHEVMAIGAWHDDFPYYSDGSWSAVNLRGYRPDDPRWGIKPAEMPRQWKAEHPEAAAYQCDWTTLADRTPVLRELAERVPWWARLERVRLLRMAGRGGLGGVLRRHCDITDRSAGTRDGQVVRFHLPLLTHPQIVMHTWDLSGRHRATHLRPWTWYYLDQRKPHAVVNPTPIDRVHLVADVVVDAEVRARLG